MIFKRIFNKLTGRSGKQAAAYSLIEVMVYLAMVGVFATVVVSYWFTMNDMNSRSQAMQAVENDAQAILTTLTQTVRNATAITVPAAGAQGNTLSISVPTTTLSPTVFTLSGGDLVMQEGTAAPQVLNSSRVTVTDLNFTNAGNLNSPGAMRIQITLSYKNSSGRTNLNYSQTFYTSAALH